MARLITERIAELRKEIVEIQSANHLASISIPYQDREAMKQRREERLRGETKGDYERAPFSPGDGAGVKTFLDS